MAFLGLLPAIFGALSAAWIKKNQKEDTVDLETPTPASTSVLLSQERERRKSQNRVNRASTNTTGGLFGVPTVARSALWGM